MKVHLITSSLRGEALDSDLFENVLGFLQQSTGPIQFIPAWQVHPHALDIPAFSMLRPLENKANFNVDTEVRPMKSYFPTRHIENEKDFLEQKGEANTDREELPLAHPTEERFAPWAYFFEICSTYRIRNEIPNEDHVFLLTALANDKNWFGSIGPSGRDYFVHAANWEYFLKDTDSRFPIAYEVVVWLLRHQMFSSSAEMLQGIHGTPRGCANDFCKDKQQIQLKMRTGDVCSTCLNILQVKGREPLIIAQILDVFERVRLNVLFRARAAILRRPSRLEVRGFTRRLFFTDLGNLEVRLNPKEKTIFLFFLNHPEGVLLSHMVDHRSELEQLYSILSPTYVAGQRISEAIDLLVNPTEGNLQQVLSRIKRKLESNLGVELAKHYLISGPHGEPKRIAIDREFVTYNI
jgi:hypothetical protein